MLDVRPMLPVGNYTIKKDEYDRFYFEQVDSFDIGHKIYGDTLTQVNRIINTFKVRPNSTGVLLTGEKGSGKTLLAKMLSIKCAEQNIPTIIINTPWHGEEFNTLIQSLEQETLILFDEFEKVYDEKEQTAILTLLDGVFPSKKLFVLTCNDKWRIDQHMQNRPGRIFYLLDFHGLDITFITEYCNDVLNDKSQISNVCRVSSMFAEFNFDLLKALCEEMNRYNETAQEAIKMLNAKPQERDGGRFKVTLRINNLAVPENETSPIEWRGNPVARENFMIKQVSPYDIDDDDDDTYPDIVANGLVSGGEGEPSAIGTVKHQFTYLHLKKVDPTTGTFVYSNDSGATVTFTRIKEKFNFYAF
jgi:hypothetical protein